MRVIAIIDNRQVVEKILRHLGLWTERQPLAQARPLPDSKIRRSTSSFILSHNMPEYENVLTD
jgi:hypothetical protein